MPQSGREVSQAFCSSEFTASGSTVSRHNETKTERDSEAGIHIWTFFLSFNRRSYLQQLTTSSSQRDREPDSQTGERGRRGEKTMTGKQRVLYLYFLFDADDGISRAALTCGLIVFEQRRSLIVIVIPLGGINLHYFLNPGVLLSAECSIWELFAVL